MNCNQDGCGRSSRARGMCEMHYQRAKRAGLDGLVRQLPSKPSTLERLAQEGRNRSCRDCGGVPLFGGMRCLSCFRRRCDERKAS